MFKKVCIVAALLFGVVCVADASATGRRGFLNARRARVVSPRAFVQRRDVVLRERIVVPQRSLRIVEVPGLQLRSDRFRSQALFSRGVRVDSFNRGLQFRSFNRGLQFRSDRFRVDAFRGDRFRNDRIIIRQGIRGY